MKANEVTLNNFLSQTKTQFIIPVYQRNYDWTEEQCRQLFYDIVEVGSKLGSVHFIGSIVFIHEGVYTSNEVKKLVVIDGQQRLTTFTLLYLALYRFAQENGHEERGDEINDTFLTNKYVKDEGNKLKLKQSENNARAFRHLLSNAPSTQFNEFSKIINNYNYFRRYISNDNFETILSGIERLIFVEISLERGKDDPQRIFESLNSTGLELSQADLIRNYILMGLAPEEQERIYEQCWAPIEQNAKDLKKEESRVSDFIRDYLTFKNKKIPNKSAVYDEFKLRYANRNSKFYSESMDELRNFSFQYSKLINPSKESDKDIRKELSYIKRLEITVSFPFLLPVYIDFVNKIIDKAIFLKILKFIQSYIWRRFIVGLQTNALNKIFMNLYTEVDTSKYLESVYRAILKKRGDQRFPTNIEIEMALAEKDVYNIHNRNIQYFLELLENYNNREYVLVDSQITIEHIFPQHPDIKWRENLSEEEFTLMSTKYLHTIANLTLSGNNSSLGNKPFIDKKAMNKNGGKQGYEYSRLWLNDFLIHIDEWNVENLEKRRDLLISQFFKVWEFPILEMDDDNELDEDYTIFDAPDPKYKKLDYFIYKNEKIVTDEIAKMYYHVITNLVEENTAAFNHPDLKQAISLSTNSDELREPYEIKGGYFIESNINSSVKFARLKTLLTYFNLQDELIINFSNKDSDLTDLELSSRESWEERATSEALYIIDSCISLLVETNSELGLNYTNSYIGINRSGKPYNFVVFKPRSTFVRLEVLVSNPYVWSEILYQSGFKISSIGRKGRLKLRVDRDNVNFHKDKLRSFLKQAYLEWAE